ncbi:MAG: O-antigen ligase family protein [Anaerolineaceae bacterium]|nr:O-antigen ligase family protein [Anaerolineaceae bacterium]
MHSNSGLIDHLRKTCRWLSCLEIWVLFIAILAAAAKETFQVAAIGAAIFFVIVRLAAFGKLSQRTPVDWFAGFFVLIVLLNFWVTPLPQLSTPQLLRVLFGILVFYSIINWVQSPEKIKQVLLLLIFCGVISACVTPVIILVFGNRLPALPPVFYTYFGFLLNEKVNPNTMAGFLVVLFPLAMAGFLFTRGWGKTRWVFGISTLVMLAMLVLTKSRGALLAAILVFLFFIVIHWRWGWIAAVLAAASTGIAVLYLTLFQSAAILSSEFYKTLETRFIVWDRSIMILKDFPLTGIGMGTFLPVTEHLYPFFLPEAAGFRHAHNLFLQIGIDLGLPGLLLWLVIFGFVIRGAWLIYQSGSHARDRWAIGLGCGLLGSHLALVVHGFSDATTWGMMRLAPLVWGIWGLSIAGQMVFAARAKE